MKSTLQRLQEIEQNGFHLNMDSILKESFENYKKITLTIGALLLVLIILFTMFFGGVVTSYFGTENLTEKLLKFDFSKYSLLLIIVNFAVVIIGTAMIAPLTAGILKIAHNAYSNEPFGFSTAFSYYKSKYFRELFIASLIIAIVTNTLDSTVRIYTVNNTEDLLSNGLLGFGMGILTGLIGLFTLFTIPLIIFGNLNATEAIKGSIKMVSKQFWIILALVLIGAFCSIMFGLIACCIGIFFTLPFMYSLQYTIYRNTFEIEEKSNDSETTIDTND